MAVVFFGSKKKASTQDAQQNVIALAGAEENDARAFATWHDGQKTYRRALGVGRHMLGNSSFATIRVGPLGKDISGYLEIQEAEVFLKCTQDKPTLFLDGRKIGVGESVVVGDIVEVMIGRHPVTIAVTSLGKQPDHMKHETGPKSSATDPLQSEADRLFHDVDRLRQMLCRKLLDQLNVQGIDLSDVESPEVRETARLKLRKVIAEIQFPKGFKYTPKVIEQQVFDEVMGLGPLEPLLADESITEIMVNRRDQIYVERKGNLELANVHFSSDQSLINVIERIVSTVGRRIDQSSPIVDARLLDGSRVNAVIPPLALKGPNLTIRRFSKIPISVDQLIGWDSMTQEMADFLRGLVEEHKNIIISGGTGSGKTTLLNALSGFVPENERIVTVEDAAELQLQQQHVISLETRPANLEGKGGVAIRDLVKNTLRMRPDRIIVGECRSGEALDMLQAMNTGHDGSMTTAHANTPEDMLRRLETMVMMAGMELPLKAIREQIASALTVVVQQTRRKSGRRLITDVSWIRGLHKDSGEYDVVILFNRDRKDQQVIHRSNIQEFLKIEEVDLDVDKILGPPKTRSKRIANRSEQ